MRGWCCGEAAALLLAVGCARFVPHPIIPSERASSLENRRLEDNRFKEFLESNLEGPLAQWPPAQWDFETLYLAALYYQPSLDVVRAQWEIALGGKETAAARPNPSVSAEPGYDLSASSGLSPWIPLVTFDLPLETAGKRGYRTKQASQLSEAARYNIASAAWQIRNNLRLALIDFEGASEKASLLERQVATEERITQLLDQQLQAGAISSSEVTLVRIALDQLRLDLYDARQQRADARGRVAEAIGIPAQAIGDNAIRYDLSKRPEAALQLISDDLRRRALESRADILGALSEYAATQSALHLQIAKQYPDIHFGPSYQYDQGDHKVSLILNAELPILNQNQGPIAEAEAHRDEAAARFDTLQAKVLSEIDRAVAGFHLAEENLSTLEDLAASQQKRSEAIAAQVRAGAADQVDLLNSQIELGASELLQLAGRTKLQLSFAALENAVQRPLDAVNPRLIEKSPRFRAAQKAPP